MRISDWSSDVCSSDLGRARRRCQSAAASATWRIPAGTRARDFRIAGARAAGAVDVLRARTESARARRGAQGQRESGLPDTRPGAAAPERKAQVLAVRGDRTSGLDEKGG